MAAAIMGAWEAKGLTVKNFREGEAVVRAIDIIEALKPRECVAEGHAQTVINAQREAVSYFRRSKTERPDWLSDGANERRAFAAERGYEPTYNVMYIDEDKEGNPRPKRGDVYVDGRPWGD